jgi:hypothetical protein
MAGIRTRNINNDPPTLLLRLYGVIIVPTLNG